MIDRKKLVQMHNPILTAVEKESALTVGNGEFAFTADVTGLQSLYTAYDVLPLCTMSQWGWHTKPVSDERYAYTLDDLVMTKYTTPDGREVAYPQKKMPGNEEVYDWLRQNPHRLNLAQVGFVCNKGKAAGENSSGENVAEENVAGGYAVTKNAVGENALDWRALSENDISKIRQELDLYEGILQSNFALFGKEVHVRTAVHNQGKDILAVEVTSDLLRDKRLVIAMHFPYGASDITASDWKSEKLHSTKVVVRETCEEAQRGACLGFGDKLCEDMEEDEKPKDSAACHVRLRRTLDRDVYFVDILTDGTVMADEATHCVQILPGEGRNSLSLSVAFARKEEKAIACPAKEVFAASRAGWKEFWEKGGIIRLNQSKDPRAKELERRIILSQFLLAVNSAGSTPPQETGLTCNSWYGKMHLEMYFWHCAWLPFWNHVDLLERSLAWYRTHLSEACENAARNGYQGARWPKMIATEGIDCPSVIAPLLVWQQPHIIWMLEVAYRRIQGNAEEAPRVAGVDDVVGKASADGTFGAADGNLSREGRKFLEENWLLLQNTADFMADFVVWNPEKKVYEITSPVIPAQECHKAMDVLNPTYEVEYWRETMEIACRWGERLNYAIDAKWRDVADHMAPLPEKDGVYLAHENCPTTFTEFNKDHPSMLAAYGVLDSNRVDRQTMKSTLELVEKVWNYPSLWGWDFAVMAMTAVRLGEPEKAIELILKETPKNDYVKSGNNRQIGRVDLPLYLPGNGSLLLAAAAMTAGFTGCKKKTPGFPDDGSWTVEFENIQPLL